MKVPASAGIFFAHLLLYIGGMKLVLIHGWGFDASFWDGVCAYLPREIEIERAELGFFGASVHMPEADDAFIAGHSLGVLYALKNMPRAQGIISLNGFMDFTQCVKTRVIHAMIAGLKSDAPRVLKDFYTLIGAEKSVPETLDVEKLAQGLEWLAAWNTDMPDCPVTALYGANDPLIPPEYNVVWNNSAGQSQGGHLLPLTHASWCAAQIIKVSEAA